MIDEELLNKFDRIQDLPVPEEMLGAYLEGNLNEEEERFVEFAMNDFPDAGFLSGESFVYETNPYEPEDMSDPILSDYGEETVDIGLPEVPEISFDDISVPEDLPYLDGPDETSDPLPDIIVPDDPVTSSGDDFTMPFNSPGDLPADIVDDGGF